jgi:hypothetical protein
MARSAAQQASQRKAALASARKRKAAFHAKNRSKLTKSKKIREYKNTGLAIPTPSRTFGQAMRKGKKASRHNVKYGKKVAKHRKKVAKYTARSR